MFKKPLFACALAIAPALLWAQSSERIRINQVGYATDQIKIAVSLIRSDSASLLDSATSHVVWRGPLGKSIYWTDAQDTCFLIDFSNYKISGSYNLQVGSEVSHPVHISENPFLAVSRGSLKAYWYQRASYALTDPWAKMLPGSSALGTNDYARAAGHLDKTVKIHQSAATRQRPANSAISSPGGWYDAGDYGKYIVNSGISTWTLLHLYVTARAFFDTLSLNVPAHGGPASDFVDEILWNLRWMLTMQDPNDGGVYHKLTTAQFSGFVMPSADNATRYVVQKSTAATLDFAAVTAYAARIFKNVPELPGLSDSCLAASLKAWAWARQNPDSIYDQTAMNAVFTPSVGTGEYGDGAVTDEFLWAGAELFLTTQADSFATIEALTKVPAMYSSPGWQTVSTLGWLNLGSNKSLLTGSLAGIGPKLDSALIKTTKAWDTSRTSNGDHIPAKNLSGNFYWGSNSAFGNNGILLWKAYQATGDTSYRAASLEILDYLLGRNATGYCFVTGFGSRSPMNIHHRPSAADGIAAPDPGLLVGGPNPQKSDTTDGCADYPASSVMANGRSISAKSYADGQACYASNEVAINWNAPLAFLAGMLAATESGSSTLGITNASGRSITAPQLRVSARLGVVEANLSGRAMASLQLLGLDGRILSRVDGPSANLSLHTAASGLFVVRVRAMDGTVAAQRIILP